MLLLFSQDVLLMDLNVWYDTKKSIYCHFLLILIRPFIEFLNLRGNQVYVLPDNEQKIEIFIYSLPTDSITQTDASLIQLSILYKISWEDLSQSYS